jgi:hypothetical protein
MCHTMLEEEMNHNSDQSRQSKTIGRRELLKALAATTGAVTAASMLPGKWAKPVVEVGLLPAHAQQTAYRLNARVVSGGSPGQVGGAGGNTALVTVEVTVTPAEAGIDIDDDVTVDSSDLGNVQTQSTDGNGQAFFSYDFCRKDVRPDFTGQGGLRFGAIHAHLQLRRYRYLW